MLLSGDASACDGYGGSWLFCGSCCKPPRLTWTVPIQLRPSIRFVASLAAWGQVQSLA